MIITMTLSNVTHVEKSLSMNRIGFTIQGRNTRRKWRDAFTKVNTNMKTSPLLRKMKLMLTQEILEIIYKSHDVNVYSDWSISMLVTGPRPRIFERTVSFNSLSVMV